MPTSVPPPKPPEPPRPSSPPIDHFVASQSGRVVATAKDLDDLLSQLRARRVDVRTILIEFAAPPRRARVF